MVTAASLHHWELIRNRSALCTKECALTRTFAFVRSRILFHKIQQRKADKIRRLTSLHERLGFARLLVFAEWSSKALWLPEASEGIMCQSRISGDGWS
jgi:hypothetical protein